MNIAERVESLREWMRDNNVAAYVITNNDPHNSEYTADYWKCREWISGFNGSAGTAVVTLDSAALWTDSRYFLQAEEQLAGTPFRLMRDGLKETPSIEAWLEQELERGSVIGFTASVTPMDEFRVYEQNSHFEARTFDDPFKQIWEERDLFSIARIVTLPLSVAGKSAKKKIAELIARFEADFDSETAYLISDLSEIAWLLNLRGDEIEYNPLFEANVIIWRGKCVLFVESDNIAKPIKEYLTKQGVIQYDSWELKTVLKNLAKQNVVFVMSPSTNVAVVSHFENPIFRPSYLALPKSIKNESETAGFRQAMLYDGVALVRFRRWLDEKVADGSIAQETECTISDRLLAFRAENREFLGLSFATIAGYAAHGAIVHYEAVPETAAQLRNEGLLLLDSGAQYTCGTTDITRTIALGALTDEERKVYTLVLKGHIALSRARFPEGTLGIQLDLAARYAMWQEGYDFGHGTGHGVGSCLCVHEGPQQIRKDLRAATQVPFQAGMTITNEPGIYLAGKFGVRIENILLTVPADTTSFGSFLAFDALTLCPIDIAPIAIEMLDETEKEWLNAYHNVVRERLLPLLSDEADRQWLEEATKPL